MLDVKVGSGAFMKNLNDARSLANKMVNLNNELLVCKTPKDEKILKLQIKKTDNKINQLVYELYGLNDAEIQIIEDDMMF